MTRAAARSRRHRARYSQCLLAAEVGIFRAFDATDECLTRLREEWADLETRGLAIPPTAGYLEDPPPAVAAWLEDVARWTAAAKAVSHERAELLRQHAFLLQVATGEVPTFTRDATAPQIEPETSPIHTTRASRKGKR
jgi:hypothetical protein